MNLKAEKCQPIDTVRSICGIGEIHQIILGKYSEEVCEDEKRGPKNDIQGAKRDGVFLRAACKILEAVYHGMIIAQ